MEYNSKKIDNLESGYPDSRLYLEIDKGHGKAKTQHLIIMPEMFN